jgi:putative restriction endonuclease
MLTQDVFTRDELSEFEFQGRRHRLVGSMTGIWRIKDYSPAAISILTAYRAEGQRRPYEDAIGNDELLRYKWRGNNPNQADNVWLRTAMQLQLPLVWFIGVGTRPGSNTQVFVPQFPVYMVAEEPQLHQFVVALEGQHAMPRSTDGEVIEITRAYNERMAKVRLHQPLFRTSVLHAYERRCAVCRLPFAELLDAAHIRSDSAGGSATVSNGLSLCKIHHGAFDSNIIGISPDYVVHVRESVLETFDGPTLQHSIKEMHGERLRQVPNSRVLKPDKDLLAERFETFRRAS